MGNISTRVINNTDEDFYRLIGPFLSRREIVKETGFPIWDEDDKTWVVCFISGNVAGFSAIKPKGSTVILCSAYVLPEFRKMGVYQLMVQERLKLSARYQKLTTTANENSYPALLKIGFNPVRKNGHFTVMEIIK